MGMLNCNVKYISGIPPARDILKNVKLPINKTKPIIKEMIVFNFVNLKFIFLLDY